MGPAERPPQRFQRQARTRAAAERGIYMGTPRRASSNMCVRVFLLRARVRACVRVFVCVRRAKGWGRS